MNLFAYLFLLILIEKTMGQCSSGCLKCNSKNSCLLCDITQLYSLSGSKCVSTTQANCQLIAQNGNCVMCASNYYVDPNTKSCVLVPTSKVVSGCGAYSGTQVCTQCSGNFFLQSGKCNVVNATIPNCQNYANNGVCGQCGNGFLLSYDLTNCVSLKAIPNCFMYTFIGCNTCVSGYLNNQNHYFVNLMSTTGITSFLSNTILKKSGYWIPLSVCQAGIVPNCLTYATYNNCAQCVAGYYLSNGNCIIYPLPSITGCNIYSSLTNCVHCQAGLYLSGNSCVAVNSITNCQAYDGSASTTSCVQCLTNYYLQNNACILRSSSKAIANCQTTSNTTDQCIICNAGYNLTTDGLACLAQVQNCALYTSSTVLSNSMSCLLCNLGYYLVTSGSSTTCVLGTVQNCQLYELNANTCVYCQNMYYLNNAICSPHLQIPNCIIYDGFVANSCEICSPGSYSFSYNEVCVQVSVISNCIAYNTDASKCTKCDVNYYLVGGVCASIPSTFANCAVFTGTVCTMCWPGYMVNTINSASNCVTPLSYVNSTSNSPCAQIGLLTSNQIPTWSNIVSVTQSSYKCITCNNYMYPFMPSPIQAICVLTSQLVLYPGFNVVSNCFRYGINYAIIQSIVCMECSTGYYLSGYQALAHTSAATTCVSSCLITVTNSNVVLLNDALGFVNVCIPYSTTGFFVNLGFCSVITRYTVNNVGTTNVNSAPYFSDDFFCLKPALNTNYPPQNFKYFKNVIPGSGDSRMYFPYEPISATVPLTTSMSFLEGYTSTVDGNVPDPTVFNYQGLLLQVYLFQSANYELMLLRNNNLHYCEILWVLGVSGIYGTPYDGGSTTFGYYPLLNYYSVTNYYGCLRCQFGYQLSFSSSGSIANNSPLPSCQIMSLCGSSSMVYGGLAPHLNSVFSCHYCLQSSGIQTYPLIVMDIDAVGTNPQQNAPGVYISYTVRNIFSTNGMTVSTRSGFSCAVPLNTLIVDDATPTPTTQTSIANCAAYGVFYLITSYANPNGDSSSTALPATIQANTIFNVAAQGDTNGGLAAPNDANYVTYNFCLACGANYYPTYMINSLSPLPSFSTAITPNNRFPAWVVVGCTGSLNCDTSVTTQFNSCGKCRTDLDYSSTPQYYAFMDFTVTNCYRSSTPNCLILDPVAFSSTATTNNCLICKSGYYYNADYVCEKLSVPNMVTSSANYFTTPFFASKYYVNNVFQTVTTNNGLIYLRYHYLLSYSGSQYGASNCVSGYTLAPIHPWVNSLCVTSSYVYNFTNMYPLNSFFVNNCIRYNTTLVGGKNVCGGCTSGYIPTIDGVSCVSNSGMSNCLFAQSGINSGLCYQCANNYVNVNGICSIPKISNCASYVNNAFSFTAPSSVQCASCISGFFLSSDYLNCQAGKVQFCQIYAQGVNTQCIMCQSGYVLVILNTLNYCYPASASLNCMSLQDSSSSTGLNAEMLTCSQCMFSKTQVYGMRVWTSTLLTSPIATLCMPFNLIQNCIQYNQNGTTIANNTFGCLQCASGYYFSSSSGLCLTRNVNPSNCIAYSQTADICSQCNPGYFLSPNGQTCTAFPVGIQNCLQYSGPTTCILCSPGSFVNNGICINSVTIQNCAVYSANNTCTTCNSGYYLNNATSCTLSVALSCLTYNSINSCSTCGTGYGLSTSNGVTSCVLINIPNCINSTTVAPFACNQCGTGFYANAAGSCVQVTQLLSGCFLYDTASTCIQCNQGYLLSADRTSCNSTGMTMYMDPNCADQFLMSTPSCAVCQLGYYLNSGNCTQCANNTLSSGCFSCDPNDQTQCLFCNTNFYMTASGNCVRSSGNNNTVTPVNPTTPTSSLMRMAITPLMLLVLNLH